MITAFFLALFYPVVFILTLPLRLFDNVAQNNDMVSALGNLGQYLSPLEPFLPIGTLLIIFGLFITIEAGIFTYKGIMWIIRRFPTQS